MDLKRSGSSYNCGMWHSLLLFFSIGWVVRKCHASSTTAQSTLQNVCLSLTLEAEFLASDKCSMSLQCREMESDYVWNQECNFITF
ncbi:hypothetical protein DFH28DRAFT_983470 [Melampsora americana]|nr:hypothetical protein DFH28DRAFT_983470 [Melampsora americana]